MAEMAKIKEEIYKYTYCNTADSRNGLLVVKDSINWEEYQVDDENRDGFSEQPEEEIIFEAAGQFKNYSFGFGAEFQDKDENESIGRLELDQESMFELPEIIEETQQYNVHDKEEFESPKTEEYKEEIGEIEDIIEELIEDEDAGIYHAENSQIENEFVEEIIEGEEENAGEQLPVREGITLEIEDELYEITPEIQNKEEDDEKNQEPEHESDIEEILDVADIELDNKETRGRENESDIKETREIDDDSSTPETGEIEDGLDVGETLEIDDHGDAEEIRQIENELLEEMHPNDMSRNGITRNMGDGDLEDRIREIAQCENENEESADIEGDAHDHELYHSSNITKETDNYSVHDEEILDFSANDSENFMMSQATYARVSHTAICEEDADDCQAYDEDEDKNEYGDGEIEEKEDHDLQGHETDKLREAPELSRFDSTRSSTVSSGTSWEFMSNKENALNQIQNAPVPLEHEVESSKRVSVFAHGEPEREKMCELLDAACGKPNAEYLLKETQNFAARPFETHGRQINHQRNHASISAPAKVNGDFEMGESSRSLHGPRTYPREDRQPSRSDFHTKSFKSNKSNYKNNYVPAALKTTLEGSYSLPKSRPEKKLLNAGSANGTAQRSHIITENDESPAIDDHRPGNHLTASLDAIAICPKMSPSLSSEMKRSASLSAAPLVRHGRSKSLQKGGKIDRVARFAELQKIWKKDTFLRSVDGKKRPHVLQHLFAPLRAAKNN